MLIRNSRFGKSLKTQVRSGQLSECSEESKVESANSSFVVLSTHISDLLKFVENT